ncbi:hypothetical protein KBX06_17975 [Micromonospora sp. C31]|uniref:hypothetical protein n=1 Tax=Micromonospora sp. C31 TaxID=2824876 RepID=UPI001B38A579|nr:hypothetical protein [Micromonospora sp. C31]MBQ1075040.1 hypothetical protein [Micromonospora sp. C31]
MATLAAVLVITGQQTPAVAGGDAEPAPAPAGQSDHRVTLITGDRVTVSPDGARVTVTAAPGRAGTRFTSHRAGGHRTVLPEDARPLVAAGLLDRRLFDVTALVRAGYDDARSPGLPLIVTRRGADPAAGLTGPGLRTTGRFAVAGASAVTVVKADVASAWSAIHEQRAGIERIWLDTPLTPAPVPAPSTDLPPAPSAGGAAPTVAVLSTGVDAERAGPAVRVAHRRVFVGASTGDRHGHGTRTAAAVPGATLLDGKVCADDGRCPESAVLAGLEWAAGRADVVDLGVGGAEQFGTGPLGRAVERISERTGALVLTPAPDGPAAPGPGARTTATHDGPDGRATGLPPSGAVTGAALLARRHPDWSADRLRAALAASEVDGALDAAALARRNALPATALLDFGVQRWPHTDDRPRQRTLTWHNHGDRPVELRLDAALTGPDGTPAPAGALRLDAATVTVPAGGSASATVTADTRHDGPDGRYTGTVTATPADAPDLAVRSRVEVEKEVESHALTVRHLGPDGRPTGRAETMVLDLTGELRALLYGEDGVATARLPKGSYVLVGDVVDFGDTESTWHRLVQPELVLDADATVTMDARRTAPVRTTVPRPDARTAIVDLGFDRRAEDGTGFGLALALDGFEGLRSGQLGPDLPAERMTGYLHSAWAVPGPAGDFRDTPYSYGLLDTRPGGFFTGFDRKVADRDLATVDSRLVAQVTGRAATKAMFPTAPGVNGTLTPLLPYRLPARTTHLLEGGATLWSAAFGENVPGGDGLPVEITAFGQANQSYQAGQRYTDRWNAAVLGPMFDFAGHAGRRGDTVWFGIPMYSDQDGHRAGSLTDAASTRMYRDGRLVGASGAGNLEAEVPPGPATFRVEKRTSRPSYSGLSTRVDATWTFRSGTAGEADEIFPLWVVRYAPTVDDHNVTRWAPVTLLPVSVMSQPEARVGRVRQLTVRVSVDGGRTWRKAPVVLAGDGGYRAVVHAPRGTRTVSLRATLVDSHGNRLDQTIVDAYRFAK